METFESRVRAVVEDVRPMLKADGGDVDLVAVDEARGRVEVHLKGACSTCAASIYTLALGLESRLKAAIPEVQEVVNV